MGSATSIIKLSLQSNQYEQKLRGAKRQFEDFTASIGINMKKMTAYGLAAGAAASAINGLTSAISDAVTEGTRMAKEMEGVKAAFSRLNQPNLLNNLREATHGTVNDLELMKQAVKFDNFNLSLEQMGTMLAFAQQQAKDTGQDVGYLVDSIVTGLGRKSLPILDNLGLSATEIRDRMKGTGDMTKAVAQIIEERMAAAGGYVETAADRAARATTDMQNAMMELGKVFAPLTESANTFFSAVQIGAIKSLTYIGKLMNTLSGSGRAANVASGEDAGIQKGLGKLRVAKAAGSDYMVRRLYNDQVESYNRRINDYDAQIKNGGKRPGAGSGESRDIRWLQAQRDGLVIARDQYIQQAKQIMTPIVNNTTVDTGGSGGGGGRTDKVVEDSIDEILAKQWETASRKMATMADSLRGEDTGPSDAWKLITTNADEATDSITSLAKAFGELNKTEGLPENGTGQPEDVGKNTKSMAKEMEKFVGISDGMLGGINNIVGGLQGLGVEIPKELQGVIGGIQGLMSIVTGIAAILSIIQTLQAIQTTESTIKATPVIGWLLAQGGVVHAANGYVPGNKYSGDQVPALLNSGELVLNKAQQGNLASQLQGNGLQNMNISGRIKGTDIILSVDRTLQLQGKQLLTWG